MSAGKESCVSSVILTGKIEFGSMTQRNNWCYAQIVELNGCAADSERCKGISKTNVRFVRWKYRSVEEDAGLLK